MVGRGGEVDEREAAFAVALAGGLGPSGAHRLRRAFGSWRAVVRAAVRREPCGDARMERMLGGVAEALAEDAPGRERAAAARAGARVVVTGDDEYPEALAEIARPPLALFVRGADLRSAWPALAIVGTRRASPEGLIAARGLAAEVAEAGLAVVSGLARGVDTAAHRGALDAAGTTVAVLGSGLDEVYPPENERLADSIAAAGAVVSEFPMSRGPRPGQFPSRNRIIAGLSVGVLVVEAGRRSGALITAARALESGREVFAVPGPIDRPGSRGPNGLIKAGAKLVESVADITEELAPAWGPFRARGEAAGLAAGGADAPGGPAGGGACVAAQVRSALSSTPLGADAIAERLALPVSDVLAALTELELSGGARAWPGGRYTSGRGRRSGPKEAVRS